MGRPVTRQPELVCVHAGWEEQGMGEEEGNGSQGRGGAGRPPPVPKAAQGHPPPS